MKKSGFISGCVAVLLLLTTVMTFAQKDQPLDPAIKDALYLFDTDQPTKGLAELNKLASANSGNALYLYYLGYGYIKTGDRANALATFDKGIALNAEEPLNYVGKGYLNMLEKKPAEAKVNFDKATGMTKSKSVAVLKGIAEAYDIDNKYSVESVALLNKAKAIADTDAEIQILLGDTYLIQNAGGNVGQSVSAYENAIMIKLMDAKLKSRYDAKAHYKIGMVYEKAKNNDVALENFEKAVKVDPNYTPAYRELGQLYYLIKKAPESVQAYEKFLSMTEKPETPKYQYEYAFFLFMNKEYKKANAIFEKVINSPDVKALTLRFYGKSLYESEDYEKALTISDQYLEKANPEDIDANDYKYVGDILVKLKKDSLALIQFQKSIDLNQDQPAILMQMANLAYKNKKWDQSIKAYKTMMSLRKAPNAQDFYSIGRAYYNNSQFLEADSSLTKFTEMQPEIAAGWFWLARTKASLDPESTKGLAKPVFEKALEKATVEKNKNDMVEAYRYLGYYYYLKGDAASAKASYKKLLELKPDDSYAKDAIDTLDKIGKTPSKAPAKKTTK